MKILREILNIIEVKCVEQFECGVDVYLRKFRGFLCVLYIVCVIPPETRVKYPVLIGNYDWGSERHRREKNKDLLQTQENALDTGQCA